MGMKLLQQARDAAEARCRRGVRYWPSLANGTYVAGRRQFKRLRAAAKAARRTSARGTPSTQGGGTDDQRPA